MNNMPLKLRKNCADDPYYATCARFEALHDHECKPDPLTGRLIEWEHAFTYAGRQIQRSFAIVPLCWLVHRGPLLNKQINHWLALNRATPEEMQEFSKAINFTKYRAYLNKKWGYPVEKSQESSGKPVDKHVDYLGILYPWRHC